MLKFGALFADILILDDDQTFIRSARRVLQAAGYTVRCIDPGKGALEAIESRPPDLILMEIEQPNELNGRQLARRIKAHVDLPFIPIIVTTHEPTQDQIAAALNAGADEFIAKPVHNAELLTRVRAMLRLKASTDQLADLNATLEQKVVERTALLEQAQARLRHAEKLSALGRLSASIAHEINNPLSAILLHIYVMEKAKLTDPTLQESLGIIEGQIETIARLVEELRNFSKPPRKERAPVNLNDTLENVLALTGKELQKHKITIVREFDAPLPPVSAAPDQMEEVFMNLIVNARDAMEEGGALTIQAGTDGDWVQIQVSDTGPGIPPEIADRIFEPFFTTKGEKGTGLGLSICHSIIQEHGGDIRVESQRDEGATFTIRLPIAGTKNHTKSN
jgi:two-component system, NtrC family, sensor kinase